MYLVTSGRLSPDVAPLRGRRRGRARSKLLYLSIYLYISIYLSILSLSLSLITLSLPFEGLGEDEMLRLVAMMRESRHANNDKHNNDN